MYAVRRRRFVAVAALVSAAVSAVVVSPTSALAADTDAPVLTSVSATPRAVGPDQVVTVSYAATSASSELSLVDASFRAGGASYSFHASVSGTAPKSGTVELTIPQGASNGTYTLNSVTLSDPAGHAATYLRSGAVTLGTGATGPTSHTVDFTTSDVTLSGSTQDRTAPTLDAISITDPSLAVGETATAHYEVSDVSLLASVTISYVNQAAALSVVLPTTAGLQPRSGDIVRPVPQAWANGSYEVTRVTIRDRFLNTANYYPDGRVTTPAGTGTHTLDLTKLALTISGSTADFTPPVVISIGQPTSPVLAGATVRIPYVATDAAGSLGPLTAQFTDDFGNSFTLQQASGPLSGLLQGVAAPQPNRQIGTYRLARLTIEDPAGRRATYDENGYVTQSPGGVKPHALDLASHLVRVARVPSASGYVAVTPTSGGATVVWDPVDDGGTPLKAYTVTASPGGKVVTVSPTAGRATFTGLTNKTRYTFTVRGINGVGTGAGRSASGTPRAFGQRLLSPGDFDDDGHNDILGINGAGKMVFYRGNGRGGFAASGKVIGAGWQINRLVFTRQGPLESGLMADAWAVRFDGSLQYYGGGGGGRFDYSDQRGAGWDVFANVFTAGDFSGDGYPDVMGIKDNGDLYYYRHKWQTGSFYSGIKIGTGWNTFTQVFTMGDQTGDLKNDVVGIKRDGTAWLYAGNGKGGWAAGGRRMATGLTVRAAFSTDFDGGGADLLTVDSQGNLRLYRGNNRGGLSYRGVINKGWNIYL